MARSVRRWLVLSLDLCTLSRCPSAWSVNWTWSRIYGLSLLQLYSYIAGRCSSKDGFFLKAFVSTCLSFISSISWPILMRLSRLPCWCKDACTMIGGEKKVLTHDFWFIRSVNSLHLILVCHSLYYYTITHFADFEALAVSTWWVVPVT